MFPYVICLLQSLVQAFLTLAVLNNSKQLPGIQVGGMQMAHGHAICRLLCVACLIGEGEGLALGVGSRLACSACG
jgi:hypothetical protein